MAKLSVLCCSFWCVDIDVLQILVYFLTLSSNRYLLYNYFTLNQILVLTKNIFSLLFMERKVVGFEGCVFGETT